MEDNNVPQDNPVQDQPVVEEPQVETPVEEAPAESTAPIQEEPQEQAVAPEPAPAVPDYDISQFIPQQQPQPSFTPDEDGYIDPNQFYNAVLQDAEARMEQKMQFQEQERRAWQAVEDKYPEVKADPELRDLVNAQRLADVARGGKGDLNEIAQKVVGKLQSYRNEGKAQAQVSEKVQKSAALQQTTANNTDTTKDQDLMERMSRGDSNAAEQLVSEWIKAGKI